MKRGLIISIPLLFFSFFSLSAQESSDVADGQIADQTESEISESDLEVDLEADDDADTDTGSDADSRKIRREKRKEKIKALYNEYQEKSDEVNEKQRISGFQFLGDFITDKLPLTLDLGAEPGEHGSTIFGVLQYDWTPVRASRIRMEYQSLKTSADVTNRFSATFTNKSGETTETESLATDWLTITKTKQIEVDFYPYLRYFGDESRQAKTPFIYFGLGAFYLYNWYDINYSVWTETETKKGIGNMDVNGDYHQFGPIAIASIKVPFLKYFGLTLETTFSPINRVINSSDVRYTTYSIENTKTNGSESSTGKKTTTSSSTDNSQWCSPLIKIDLAIDVFTYFRLRTRFNYSRVYLGGLKEVNFISFATDESREETFQWRYGLEIVFPSSNRTRKKNSHLWAGVYYEHQWDSTTTDGTNNTTHTGKWIFCFGT